MRLVYLKGRQMSARRLILVRRQQIFEGGIQGGKNGQQGKCYGEPGFGAVKISVEFAPQQSADEDNDTHLESHTRIFKVNIGCGFPLGSVRWILWISYWVL